MSSLFAVFGNPILHSKSPQLFRSVFKGMGIDAFYTRIRPQSASDILEVISDLNISGANVTAPFKEELIGLLGSLSPEAKAIGAVNTIVNSHGVLTGYNTDWIGVVQSLTEAGVTVEGSRCLVLGAGGAARAAAYGLVRTGAKVFVANRTFEKAQRIALEFGCEAISLNDIGAQGNFDFAVSTLLPEVELPFPNGIPFPILLDASYKPSALSRLAQGQGVTLIGGERWLVHQAVGAFAYYFGEQANQELFAMGLSNALAQSDVSHQFSADIADASQVIAQQAELIISSKGLTKNQLNDILNEEYSKAFKR